jgi:hypothetical protein
MLQVSVVSLCEKRWYTSLPAYLHVAAGSNGFREGAVWLVDAKPPL